MITLSKIAKLANVSVSTASKAFSMSREVNEETREEIFRIAKKYGCFKKFYSAKYPKFVVAVICPEFKSMHYAYYLSYIQQYLKENNCEVCVAASEFSPLAEKELLEYYYKYSTVDGIIIIGSQYVVTEKYETPIVFINPVHEQNDYCSVKNDLKGPIDEAVEYLTGNGVEAIGFLGESLTNSKLEMFKDALQKRKIKVEDKFISTSAERFERAGYTAMESLISAKNIPRAIICAYDYLAIGAIKCLRDHGLSVPDDVAVLGMDDIPEAKFLNPPLASISTQTDEICHIAAESLVQQIHGECTACKRAVASVLHFRESFEITK